MRFEDDLLERVRSARNKRAPVYVVRSTPTETVLREAAAVLSLDLPESYLQFCTGLGIGDFNEELRLLDHLYALDMPGLESSGYIAVATDDLGNYLAFNPNETLAQNERSLYYFCHDPFGFGVAGNSFGEFITALVARDFDYHGIVDELPSFKEVTPPDQNTR
ncbi:hypothetical protein FACS1894101_0860 [Betaproteobacteria bacterium]|nr:hypothetical protein FACS1894101_0860 [Betaproteobacteria bacterium]